MTDTTPADAQEGAPEQVRPFAAVIQEINNGDFADQLGRDILALVNAVRDRSRKGSLTVKFEVSPRKGNTNALNLVGRRDLKLPQEEPIESVFFADARGNLLRDDPRQLALPLREVSKPAHATNPEIRKVGQ
ncbi:MAG: hypothetical protein ACRDP6_14850 [Actinoallomurus sp.]